MAKSKSNTKPTKGSKKDEQGGGSKTASQVGEGRPDGFWLEGDGEFHAGDPNSTRATFRTILRKLFDNKQSLASPSLVSECYGKPV